MIRKRKKWKSNILLKGEKLKLGFKEQSSNNIYLIIYY